MDQARLAVSELRDEQRRRISRWTTCGRGSRGQSKRSWNTARDFKSHVAPLASRGRCPTSARRTARDPARLNEVIDELLETAPPGLMASAESALLRLRDRWQPGRCAGGRCDHFRLGPCAYNVAYRRPRSHSRMWPGWIKELLGLPATASVGFATGGQGANTVGIAAGRWQVLHRRGWDVGRDGLHGAPEIRVVVGAERRATIDRSVRLLGLGKTRSLWFRPSPTVRWIPTHSATCSRRQDRADDRLRRCRQREYGRVRRHDSRRRSSSRRRCLGPRRRSLRALGDQPHARLISIAESSWQIRGRATGTSGLTSPTTRGYAICADPGGTRDSTGGHGVVSRGPGGGARVRRWRLRP